MLRDCSPPQAVLPACRFTSDSKEQFAGVSGVCITTYTMIAYSGKRSEESEAVSATQTSFDQHPGAFAAYGMTTGSC